ncbi:MAG: hypothetical protein QXH10_10145 [Ignisphaera sp.]
MRARNTMYILYGSILTVIAVAIAFTYFYGPRLLWSIWVKLRANYMVRLGSGGNSKSMILNSEVWAVVMAVILVGTFSQHHSSSWLAELETFSKLDVLGPRMKIGDYPKTVVVGEEFKLYSYAGNHMDKPMYHVVLIKLGNTSKSVDPMSAEPFIRIDLILLHGENRTIPIDIALTEPDINKGLVFKLWIYNSTVEGLQVTR